MNQSAPRSIDEYLKQLRGALEGEDPALIQDALYDAEGDGIPERLAPLRRCVFRSARGIGRAHARLAKALLVQPGA